MSICKSTAQAHTKTVVLVRRSCVHPGDVLSKRSLHDLVHVIVRRSCDSPGEILSKRSLHDLAQLLMQRSCGDLGRSSCGDPDEII